MENDLIVSVEQIRRALCEYCEAGEPFIVAEGWSPNMFHNWPEGGTGARVKCYAFDVVSKIASKANS